MNRIRLSFAAAIALSLGACSVARAEVSEITVGIHAYTYHFDESQDFNNYNPGAYLVWKGWTAGAYYNSEKRTSVYGGYTFRAVLGTPIDVTVGAVTGYMDAKIKPLVVPSVLLQDHVRLSLLLPPEKEGWGLHVSFEF